MWFAAMWGAIAGSAVSLGALFALIFTIPKRLTGFIMAFGTGVLIGAAAYELLEDSAQEGGLHPTAYGFLLGAVVYTLFELIISSHGGAHRKRSDQSQALKKAGAAAGVAIFAGTLMDAIPESVMIGGSLLNGKGVDWLLIIAIFISNIPEGLSSTVGLRKGGFSTLRIVVMWGAVLLISTIAAMAGYLFLSHASANLTAGIAAFAGGGIIAMLATTMLPEAYEEGGPLIGLIASLGMLSSLLIYQLS